MSSDLDNGLKSKLFTSIRWQAVFNILSMVITPLTFLLLSRKLSPEDFGLLAIVWLFVNVSKTFVDMGLNASLIQKKEIDDSYLSTAFLVNLFAGVAMILITLVVHPYVSMFFNMPQLSPYLIVASSIFLINGFGSVQESVLKREMSFKKTSTVRITAVILYAFVSILLVELGVGVWSIIAGQILSCMVSSSLFWLLSRWRPKNLVFKKDLFIDLFTFGSGVSLNNLVTMVSNMDTILIGRMLGPYSLGLYNISFQITNLLPSIPINAVSGVVFPLFSKYQDNLKRLSRTYLDAVKYLSIVGAPVCIGFLFVAPGVVDLILTDQWAEATPIMQLLPLAFLMNVIGGGLWGPILYSLGKSYEVLKLTLIRLLALAIFMAAGIVLGGLVGAVVSYVIYGLIFRFVYQYFVNRLLGITMLDYVKAFLPGVASAGVMATVLLIASLLVFNSMPSLPSLVLTIATGAIAYLATLIIVYNKEYKLILGFFTEPLKSVLAQKA